MSKGSLSVTITPRISTTSIGEADTAQTAAPDILQTDEVNVAKISAEEFNAVLQTYIEDRTELLVKVFDEGIQALLKSRDFLSLQLDAAYGNISPEEFEAQAAQYLEAAVSQDEAELTKKIVLLLQSVSNPLDVEAISTILSCDIHQAEKVLRSIASWKK